MPITTSWMFVDKNSSKSINPTTASIQRLGCCQFLHKTKGNYGALVPMKYFYNYKDISETYEKWLKFVKDKFEIELGYEFITINAKGIFVYDELIEISKWASNEYMSFNNAVEKIEKYKGALERSRRSNLWKNGNSFYAWIYGVNAAHTVKKGTPYGELKYDSRLRTLEIPAVIVRFQDIENHNHNSIKYLNWFMVRFFQEHQKVANFLMDNEKMFQDLIDSYGIGWYNIFMGLTYMLGTSTIGYLVKEKVTKDSYLKAFDNYIKKVYIDRNISFRWMDHELSLDRSIREMSSIRDGFNYDFSYNDLEDTLNGKLTDKDTKKVLKALNFYLSKVHGKCTQ